MQIHGMQNKCLQIMFFNNPNKFFVIPVKFAYQWCNFPRMKALDFRVIIQDMQPLIKRAWAILNASV